MIKYRRKIELAKNSIDTNLAAFNVGYTKYSVEELKKLTATELERENLVCENLKYKTGTRKQLEQLSIKELMTLRDNSYYQYVVELEKHTAEKF